MLEDEPMSMRLGRVLPLQLLLLIAALIGAAALPARPALAQDDPALHIYQLARALHADDIKNENFTFWIKGDIGEALSIPISLHPGDTMPDFTFQELTGSGKLSRADLTSPYLLNLWASWCGPCRDEFPVLDEAISSQQLSLPIYFINVLDVQSEAITFSEPYRARLKLYIDLAHFAEKTKIDAIPQTYLIDARGKIQAIHLGNMTPAAVAFFAAIAAHPSLGAFDRLHPDNVPAPDYF
jgi:cytochrome c biogenesis protein CcmG/thiol:disulfide interchange protein DsbE